MCTMLMHRMTRHSPECDGPEGLRYVSPNAISPNPISPNPFHRKDILPNGRFTERPFHRMDISPNGCFTEWTFQRIHFTEWMFFQKWGVIFAILSQNFFLYFIDNVKNQPKC